MEKCFWGSFAKKNRATSISVNAMGFRLSWVVFGALVFFLGTDAPRQLWAVGALFLLIGALAALMWGNSNRQEALKSLMKRARSTGL